MTHCSKTGLEKASLKKAMWTVTASHQGMRMDIKIFLVISFLSQVFGFCEESNLKYEKKFINQYVDHFNYQESKTFQQRYLISDKYWSKDCGPIFFYTGNEGDITNFWNNTGFVMKLAKQFEGLVVFGEHRYYGESKPFGDNSFDTGFIGFLTIEQALADYAVLIDYIKSEYNAKNNKVFAIGGSYGGVLTGYMRYKYPHIIDGGLASSAPFFIVQGDRPREEFFATVTNIFLNADASCPTSVSEGFADLVKHFENGGFKKVSDLFNLCIKPLRKENHPSLKDSVIAMVRNVFFYLAMLNYPYRTNFMAKVPANPVKEACKNMTGADKLAGLAEITKSFYGTENCIDPFTEFKWCSDPTGCKSGEAWNYQTCTEMIMPGGSKGEPNDMFPELPLTLDDRKEYCAERFDLGESRLDWLNREFFGSLDEIKKTSRLIFANGDLDPWGPGGVLESLSDSLIAINITGGAHHLELRSSHEKDPTSVIMARAQIAGIFESWMRSSDDN